MTELKEFLFDFDFDDIQLMEEIDQAASEKEILNDDDVLVEPDAIAPTYSEEDLLAARQEGFAVGKEEGVKETLSGVENTMSQILDTIAMGISGVVKVICVHACCAAPTSLSGGSPSPPRLSRAGLRAKSSITS